MDYLADSTSQQLDQTDSRINASGQHVVVIGGGDAGTDCCGTAMRQGCQAAAVPGMYLSAPV